MCVQIVCKCSAALFCRGVPEPASLPAEPIALLDDMDGGVSFTSAAAAVQQPKPKEGDAEGKAKKHKKDKHKKEGKERKHKKHKREKKGKGGGPLPQPCCSQT